MLKSITVLASALAVVASFAAHAHAQTSAPVTPGFELIVPSGTVVPTGAQGDEVRQGRITAVQLSRGLRPDLVLTGTVGWARTRLVGLGEAARLDRGVCQRGRRGRAGARSVAARSPRLPDVAERSRRRRRDASQRHRRDGRPASRTAVTP